MNSLFGHKLRDVARCIMIVQPSLFLMSPIPVLIYGLPLWRMIQTGSIFLFLLPLYANSFTWRSGIGSIPALHLIKGVGDWLSLPVFGMWFSIYPSVQDEPLHDAVLGRLVLTGYPWAQPSLAIILMWYSSLSLQSHNPTWTSVEVHVTVSRIAAAGDTSSIALWQRL